ncbi:response regulator transcription factor [Comamonas jiangduensis]|jgi:DNA-binding response OmpR family regulator|uniref:response regulator transcription factor n=1 Tax=Comamonas jiangduensis TaxID=1194168 RepID=UPI0024E05A79|nr:response regulator transcription factor [Comamonas jiangduensis]
MRIAVLDDDRLLLEMMERVIQEMGNTCQLYETGQACLQDLRRETFDMLIVDWELPDTSGPEVIRWARQHLDASLPILFITHRSEERDIVEGLQCGADDFMTKPVRVAELKARMHALLRRAYPECTDDVQTFGPYTFTRSSLSVTFGGKEVVLTYREFALALLLFQNAGRLMSRDHLREAVWGQNSEVLSRTLDTHVSRLRQVLQLRPGNRYSIAAVYGLGYRLDSHEI